MLSPVTLSEMERLPWNHNSDFNYPNMVRIATIPDGSCFFHAIVSAFFEPYQRGRIVDEKTGNTIALDRRQFIRNLRRDLSIKLGQPISDGKCHYDLLSRQKLGEFSKVHSPYTLEAMKKTLNSSEPVDNVFNEFISNVLNKDIYLLDGTNRDVYITGDDDEILFKGRPSIVILVIPGHYELVGITEPRGIRTLFSPRDPFIQAIRERYRAKVRSSKT